MLTSSRPIPVPWSARLLARARVARWRRARRVLVCAALLCLIPGLVSFVHTLSAPSNSSFFIRTVEWVRGNGGRGLVDDIERFYYSLTAPAKGLDGEKGYHVFANLVWHNWSFTASLVDRVKQTPVPWGSKPLFYERGDRVRDARNYFMASHAGDFRAGNVR